MSSVDTDARVKTLFPSIVPSFVLSWVNRWRVPARSTSSVPSRTRLGAEASPPRLRLFLTAALLAAGTGTAVAEPLRLAAMGDFPYEEPRDVHRFARLIAANNRQPPALVVHTRHTKPSSPPGTHATHSRTKTIY